MDGVILRDEAFFIFSCPAEALPSQPSWLERRNHSVCLSLISGQSVADLIFLIQNFPLFDSLGHLELQQQHSCSLHYCFPLQGVDQSSYGCRWFIPSLVQLLIGCCVLASCSVTLAGAPVTLLCCRNVLYG